MTKIMGNSQPTDPSAPGASTGKFMQYFFPIFSLIICFSYSAAFALYWVAGNLVSMGQTYAINKFLDKREAAAAAVAGEGSVK
jgi:membrane protein insertase Oxa1/YidC/SpoIIIJ